MTSIILTIACPTEAKPWIKYFGLKSVHGSRPQIYTRQNILLVVTGMGAVNMATGIGYLVGKFNPHRSSVWLNVGIAGHRDLALGSTRLLHKVTDLNSGGCIYPSISLQNTLSSEECVSVSHVEKAYAENALYEMEAWSFFCAASSFADLELVHAVKIVSDNLMSPTHQLNHNIVSELVAEQVPIIDQQIIQPLSTLAKQVYKDANSYSNEAFLRRWRFSETQRHKLNSLLSDYASVGIDGVDAFNDFSRYDTAREVLHELHLRIAQQRLSLS
jgi:adenosylhomocysteine nucleosidase